MFFVLMEPALNEPVLRHRGIRKHCSEICAAVMIAQNVVVRHWRNIKFAIEHAVRVNVAFVGQFPGDESRTCIRVVRLDRLQNSRHPCMGIQSHQQLPLRENMKVGQVNELGHGSVLVKMTRRLAASLGMT